MIKKPSFLDFQYSTVTNTVRRITDSADVFPRGCTVVVQFSTTINQTALVAGTAITGMVVKTQNKLNSSRPSLPEGVYLKSFEPTTVSTTTPSNLRKLTIAHDTKSATEIISSIQSGDTLSFSVPYGYNLSFIHLDGVMTDSNGTEIVSTKSNLKDKSVLTIEWSDGKVRVRAKLEKNEKNSIIITEIKYSVNSGNLINSILKANDKGKIKIKKVDDNTAENVEILITLPTGVSIEKTIDALYRFTDCEISISPLSV